MGRLKSISLWDTGILWGGCAKAIQNSQKEIKCEIIRIHYVYHFCVEKAVRKPQLKRRLVFWNSQ